jgi:hypothetical protein
MMHFDFQYEKHKVSEELFKTQFDVTDAQLGAMNQEPIFLQVEHKIKEMLDKQRATYPLLVEDCEKMVQLASENRRGLSTQFCILMSQTLTLLQSPTEHKAFLATAQIDLWNECIPRLAESISVLGNTATAFQALPEGTELELSKLKEKAPEFANECKKLFDLLLTLKNTNLINADKYKVLCDDTKQLMAKPEGYKEFAALAKKSYSEVAGGKLMAQMLWVAGCAAKYCTFGMVATTGDKWIKQAKEKLGAIAEADNLRNAKPVKEETARYTNDQNGIDPKWQ